MSPQRIPGPVCQCIFSAGSQNGVETVGVLGVRRAVEKRSQNTIFGNVSFQQHQLQVCCFVLLRPTQLLVGYRPGPGVTRFPGVTDPTSLSLLGAAEVSLSKKHCTLSGEKGGRIDPRLHYFRSKPRGQYRRGLRIIDTSPEASHSPLPVRMRCLFHQREKE